jgi:transposase InsO family protein
MCRVVGVSRSGFYAWRNHEWKRQDKEQRDCEDFEIILQAYKYRGYDKGINGLYMRLKRMGKRMNRKKIRRLCRKYGLQCPIRKTNPYRQMAKALKTNAIADNMVKRQFREHGPRQVLLTDITYIPLNKEFCYLSVIMDAYTKQALSHVLSQSLEVDFVLETIE